MLDQVDSYSIRCYLYELRILLDRDILFRGSEGIIDTLVNGVLGSPKEHFLIVLSLLTAMGGFTCLFLSMLRLFKVRNVPLVTSICPWVVGMQYLPCLIVQINSKSNKNREYILIFIDIMNCKISALIIAYKFEHWPTVFMWDFTTITNLKWTTHR